MADGKYLRGEAYWVRDNESMGSEEGMSRPAVIISSNHGNENNSTVVVAFLSTQSNALTINPSVTLAGRTQKVLCNQIRTVEKQRLYRFLGTLTESEMIRVSGALTIALNLPQPQNSPIKKSPANESGELLSLRAERDMWQKLYEKTMDQLVDMKLATDMAKKVESKEAAPEIPPKEPEPPQAPEEPERYEVNTCSVEDLMKCGCTLAMARLIVSYRPYKTVGDLRRVPGVKAVAFGILKQKVYCVPMQTEEKPKVVAPVEPKPVQSVPKKANVNTATAQELHEIAGITLSDAYGITAYRKKIGVYKCLEDLLQAPRYSEGKLKKHRDKLEV